MKKLIAVLLLLAMCLSLFAGCGNNNPADTDTAQQPPVSDTAPDTGVPGDEVDPDAVKSAIAYVKALYKNVAELTPQDYQRVGTVPVGAVKFDVEWTVDVSEDIVKVVRNEDGMVTIDVNENCEEETPYVLTATVTDAAGNSESLSWNHIVPAKMDALDILEAAYALAPGEELGYTVTLTGVIASVNTPYDPGYGNVTVTIIVDGHEDMPIMCYRLKGDGADSITLEDTITVTGTITNYNGTIEFNAGCVLDAVVKGEYVAPEAPSSMTQIVDEAYALGANESLPYTAVLTGIITSIKTPYDSGYDNISVVIEIAGRESKPILCYRLKGEGAAGLEVNDTITVSGTITNYVGSAGYSTIEYTAGCSLLSVVKGTGAPQAPSSMTQIVDEAYALGANDSLPYEATLKGVITSIKTPYDSGYNNISVVIAVAGREDKPILCYRLQDGSVSGVSGLAVGDTVTVTGFITNYVGDAGYSTIEFAAKCKLNGLIKGEGGTTEPEEPSNPALPAIDYVVSPEVGVPYRFVIGQGNVGAVIYFDGGIDGNFLTTTTDPAEAVNVYLESVAGGYRLYFMDGETKTYIDIQDRGEGKAKIALVTEPTAVAALNTNIAGYGILVVTIGENSFFMGTYNTYQTFSASSTYYVTGDKASTVGVTQFVGGFVAPGSEPDAPVEPEDPEVPADPEADTELSVADAIALGASKEHNTYTEGKYYVTGVITEVYNPEYGNMKITDAEGNILTVYGTYGADGELRYDALEVKPVAGDTVKVYGIIGQYNDAPQMKNGWIVEHTAGDAPVEPEDPEVPEVIGSADLMSELPVNGDTIIIYNSGNAMGADAGATKQPGVELAVDGTKLPYTADVAQLLVTVDGDHYIFTVNGKYLTSGETGNKMFLAEELTDCAKWTITSAGENVWYLMNVGANYNGNYNQAMEYYNGFTTYGHKETEIYQMAFYKVTAPAEPPVDPEEPEEPEIPATLAEQLEAASALANSEKLPYESTITGTVKINTAYSEQFGNITFTVTNEEGISVYCYRVSGEGMDTLANGDTVTVTGNLSAYNGTPQFVSGAAVTVDAKAPVVPEEPDPEADTELTIPEAIELGENKASYTEGKYYVTGVIVSITSDTYGNMYIADAEGNELLIYGTYDADGINRYDALSVKPVVGDTVKVYGVIGQYNGKAQMKNGWIVEHDHVHSLTHTELVAPTCTENGCAEYWYCESCDCHFSDAEGKYNVAYLSLIIPAGHSWKDATCDAPKTCEVCGETEGEALGHNLAHTDAVAPTCTENGRAEYWYCDVCDCHFSDAEGKYNVAYLSLTILATGHSWKDATCDAPKTCEVCGETEGEALCHNLTHTPAVAATCTTDGCGEYWYCDICDCYFADAEGQMNTHPRMLWIPAAGHNWVNDASGTSRTCSVCGHSESTVECHVMTHTPAVAATCATGGCAEYWHCSVCDGYFIDAEGNTAVELSALVVPAAGHTWKDAACDYPKYCEICGATEGEALGHNLTHTAAVAATCTENGCGEYWYCDVCDCHFSDAEGKYNVAYLSLIVPAGHSWKDATCDAPKTCETCGATEGEALGHSWPTEGARPAACDRCGLLQADVELTIPEANALGESLESYTEGKYYVTGVIVDVYQTTFGNMHLTDAEGNTFTVYGTYGADGELRYDALEVKPVAGDTVKIYGSIGQYNGTAQIKNGWIVEHIPGEHEPETEPTLTDKAIEDGVYVISTNGLTFGALDESDNYGYPDAEALDAYTAASGMTITNVDGGFTMVDCYGRYIYMKGTYNSFNVGADVPAEGHIWKLVTDGTNVYMVNVLTGKTLAYSDGYSSWGAYSNDKSALTFETYVAPAEPEAPVVPETPADPAEAPFADGDQVVIYAPAYMKALSAEKTGFYNVGIDVILNGETLSGFSAAETWTVTDHGDNIYSFAYDGQNIGLGEQYSSLNLGEIHDKWELIALDNGLYALKNVGRGNYLEWYAAKNNWSSYNSSSYATDDQFHFSFFVIESDTAETV